MIWTEKIAGNTLFPHVFRGSSVAGISSVIFRVAQVISMPSYSCLWTKPLLSHSFINNCRVAILYVEHSWSLQTPKEPEVFPHWQPRWTSCLISLVLNQTLRALFYIFWLTHWSREIIPVRDFVSALSTGSYHWIWETAAWKAGLLWGWTRTLISACQIVFIFLFMKPEHII